MPTLILSAKDLRALYTVELGLNAVERAFKAHGLGEASIGGMGALLGVEGGSRAGGEGW